MIDVTKILGALMQSGALSSQSGSNVLGSIMGALTNSNNSTGGLGGVVGSLLGGGSSGGGFDLGSLLGSAMGALNSSSSSEPQVNSFADTGNNEQEEQATLMIRAMINGAKSDGRVDRTEKAKIFAEMGDLTEEEIDYVNAEIDAPFAIEEFVESVPAGLEKQVYLMSLMGIDLDSDAEAAYLDTLARELRIDPEEINDIHRQLGQPELYA